MFDFVSSDLPAIAPPPAFWSAERYLDVLHPRDGRGVVGGLTVENNLFRSYTWPRDILGSLPATLTGQELYVALNAYYGPRGGERRLATLNALWLDLDTYRVPSLANLSRREIADRIGTAISDAGLPQPSILTDSGRGFYCIWLLSGTAPAALPRWRAAIRALTKWAKPLGADPACVDPARVLRLPESWHEKAGRQVRVVAGDGTRHPFDALADSIWRAVGGPTRRDFVSARNKRREQAEAGRGAERGPRGLHRRAFWDKIGKDLEVLLQHWGGVIPIGMRDIWLHVLTCSLAWTESDADILETVVERARTVAPGLKPQEVSRMMRTTVRRGLAAVSGQTRGCDPRYDYSSARLCELLSVDRHLATSLGLQQLVPEGLRADRNRQHRIKRSWAAGVMPRAVWLAAHSISREKPWVAEGVSRATWYRRQAEARQNRVRAGFESLMSGSADVSLLGETGSVLLYYGIARPTLGSGHAPDLIPSQNPANFDHPSEPREKTTRAADRQNSAAAAPVVSGLGGPRPSSNSTIRTEPTAPMPTLDVTVLKAASQRLSHAEVGALTCVALQLAQGSAHRLDLGRRAGVPPDMLDRIEGWLQVSTETGLVIGIADPGLAARRPHGPRQGLLFDQATVAPSPISRKSGSLCAATIAAGIHVLGRAGVNERNARSFLGQQLKNCRFGVLAEAIDAIEPKLETIAEPRSWLAAYVRDHAAGAEKRVAGSRSAAGPRGSQRCRQECPPNTENSSACDTGIPRNLTEAPANSRRAEPPSRGRMSGALPKRQLREDDRRAWHDPVPTTGRATRAVRDILERKVRGLGPFERRIPHA